MVECSICLRPTPKRGQDESIQDLLAKVRQLLNTPVEEDDKHWTCLPTTPESDNCCDKCRNHLNLLKEGCEAVVKAQEQLKACLAKIEAIVIEARTKQKTGSRPRKRKIVVVAEEDELEAVACPDQEELQVAEGGDSGDDWRNEEQESFSSSDSDFSPKKEKRRCTKVVKVADDTPEDKPSRTAWITCGIDNCVRTYSAKVNWTDHAQRCHPEADLTKRWRLIVSQKKKLVCQIEGCGKELLSYDNFKQHIKRYHPSHFRRLGLDEGLPVRCDICRDNVPRTQIAQHIHAHVGDYALPCPNPDCSLVFGTIRRYKLHLFSYEKRPCKAYGKDKNKFDTCEVCSFSGTTHQGLHNHLMVVHETINTSKSFPCPFPGCSEKFCNRQTVFFHISQRHAAPRRPTLAATSSFQYCPECSVQVQYDEIPNHFLTAHGLTLESVLSCKFCPFKAVTHLQLVDHFQVHFRGGIPVSCHICPEEIRFSRLGTLRRHYLECHQIGNRFICEHCPKVFTVEGSLKTHIKVYHTGKPRQTWNGNMKCDQCAPENPKRYKNSVDLMRHKIIDHGAEPFKCSTCLETFTSWATLREHLKFVHKNVTPRKGFPCDLPGCDYVSPSPAELVKHKASIKHVGRTDRFKCEQCGRGFNSKSNMTKHIRFVHINERKFVCEVCGLAFKSALALRYHTLIHTGEMPFQCCLCQKRFRRADRLKSHLKTHIHGPAN